MSERLKNAVKDLYGATAREARDKTAAREIARSFGYGEDDLDAIPQAANLGLSCGNPTATAALRPGETVVDLGSGAGLDVFLAARAVGPTGRAIGVDMTPDMLALAERNAEKSGLENVSFLQGEIESLPLEDMIADCVLSNCVLNLCTDKSRAFKEIARVLKSGGRLAASDIALKRPLPEALRNSLAAYVGCIAGALEIADYRRRLEVAGFCEIALVETGADLNIYGAIDGQAACCSPAAANACAPPSLGPANVVESLRQTIAEYDLNDYAAALNISARKI